MNDQMRDLLDAVQRTAETVGATAADAFACAEKKAGSLLSVGKLNVKLADLKAQGSVLMQELGGMVYATHTGAPTNSDVLLSKLEEIDQVNRQIDGITAEIARLKNTGLCPVCGGAVRPGDRFCGECGARL